MTGKFHIERITDPKDPRLEYIYRELMLRYFLPEEVDPLEKDREFLEKAANGTAKNPLVFMVAYHPKDNNPASLVDGHIIKDGGAIGYTVTRKEFRRQGLASSLLDAFEDQVRKHHKNPKLVITEGTEKSLGFWKKKGYGKVKNGRRKVVYYQPPIDFDPKTGEPLYKEVRETLVAKILDEENNNSENLCNWLVETIRGVTEEWYMPEREKFETEEAYRNAVKYTEKVVQANIDSIRNSNKLKIESFSRLT